MNRTGGTAPRIFASGPHGRRAGVSRAAWWTAGLAPFVIAVASVVVGAGGSSGCTIKKGASSTSTGVGGGSASGSVVGAGGGSGGAGAILSNKDLFEQTVLPGLEANCVPCHVNGGFADFLAPPDQYSSITVYKSGTDHEPLIFPVATQSILYTYPDLADHPGTKYSPLHDDLKAAVLKWLTQEAASLPPVPEAGAMTSIVPFSPIIGGLNVIYLDKLGPTFVGNSISFTVNQLGSPPSLLQIGTLQVYPAGVALHIVHPRFSVYPAGSSDPQPDPSDTLSDVDQVFIPQGTQHQLGPGEVLLDNWQQGGRLGLDFTLGKIESVNLTSDGGLVSLCLMPDLYGMIVKQLGEGGPMYCAENCHGGKKPTAMAAMDLSGLLATPPDYATACSYMRTRITPGDPSTSQILDVTNPANVQVIHMYKFAGNTTAYTAFTTGISPWIKAE
jgi:hypothetical protein